jgi:hypothetical protein
MTIESQVNKIRYVGNGSATVFPVPFAVWAPEHLTLYLWDDDKKQQTVMDAGYSVTGAGVGSKSCSVKLAAPLAPGLTLTILRAVPYTQPTDIRNGGDFNADTLEGSDDNLEQQIQQLAEGLQRAIIFPPGYPGGIPDGLGYLQEMDKRVTDATAQAEKSEKEATRAEEAANRVVGEADKAAASAAEAGRSADSARESAGEAREAAGSAAASAASARETLGEMGEMIDGVLDGTFVSERLLTEAVNAARLTASGLKRSLEIFKLGGY